jgi:hypothetical protein
MHRSLPIRLIPLLRGTALKRGAIFGAILVAALLAFEVFNFGTTQFALADVLGDLKFIGLRWSTILAFAFCGIDFAGIARLFTPEQGRDEPAEVWYLFGAWILAAGFNALLTWWGVSVAILNHNAAGGALLGQSMLTKAVPIFVAVMVWLIRVLIIGTFSMAGERLFTLADTRTTVQAAPRQSAQPKPVLTPAPRPAYKPAPAYGAKGPAVRSEPSYHPVGMGAQPYDENPSVRR